MGCSQLAQHSQRPVRQSFRLRKNRTHEFVFAETSRLVKHRRIKILPRADRIPLPRIVCLCVATLKLHAIQLKLIHHGRAFTMVPAVGQQDSANIEKDYVEGEHRRLLRTVVSKRKLKHQGQFLKQTRVSCS